MEHDLKKTLEALLLSTAEPISLPDLRQVFVRYRAEMRAMAQAEPEAALPLPAEVSSAQLRAALAELTAAAEVEAKAYRVVEGPHGYQIVTAPQFAEHVRLLRGAPRPLQLSPAALETLSIVAYRQPVTRAEIEAIRGVAVDGPLHRLLDLQLLVVAGRAELPGRPIQYATTAQFLEYTGIKELRELPASDVLSQHQIDAWLQRMQQPQQALGDAEMGLPPERPSPDEAREPVSVASRGGSNA